MKISETFFATADLLEERGMTSHQLEDPDTGKLCLIGGMNTILAGQSSFPWVGEVYVDASNALMFMESFLDVDWPHRWSNKLVNDGKEEVVIARVREMAEVAKEQGK